MIYTAGRDRVVYRLKVLPAGPGTPDNLIGINDLLSRHVGRSSRHVGRSWSPPGLAIVAPAGSWEGE